MKYALKLLLILFFLTPLSSCEKEEEIGSPELKPQLVGEWELREEFNPWGGPLTFQAGNGTRYQFSETTYQRYQNGNLISQGSYEIKREYSTLLKDEYYRLVLNSQTSGTVDGPPLSIMVANQQLTIQILAVDAPTLRFEKI